MMTHLREAPDAMFIKRTVSRLLDGMASLAAAEQGMAAVIAPPHRFATYNFPWIAYKLAGHDGWKKQGRENGLKPRELLKRPLEE